jgi:putative membrane protein
MGPFATAMPSELRMERTLLRGQEGIEEGRARGKLIWAPVPKERLMLSKRHAATFIPLFIVTLAGAAFASGPVSGRPDTAEKAANWSEPFSVLHAVGQWSINLSQMAERKAKSDQVKAYARDVAAANANADAKLQRIAKEEGIDVGPLDPQTEEGKSLLDRVKAETVLLESLEGDAFDKEYMTLVTNTQQSLIHFLGTRKASTRDQGVKQFLGDMTTTVQTRLGTAQDIMAKVYGDKI